MVLSDKDIKIALKKGDISIDPLFPNSIQPASIDVHLGKHFLVYVRNNSTHIEPSEPVDRMTRKVEIKVGQPFVLGVGEFALGILEECIGINNNYVGRLDGVSSIGRFGTFVHVTASTLNPGNKLCMTLELYNANHIPINLYGGMPIAQLLIEELSSPSESIYGSVNLKNNNYGGSKEPQASQYFKKFQEGNNSWMEFVKTL
jgi:dCTP deaminase